MAVPKQKQSHAAPPSAARSTRSPRRRSTRARSATARAGRTACARSAAPTPGARSSRPPSTTTSTEPLRGCRRDHRRGRRQRRRPRARRGRRRRGARGRSAACACCCSARPPRSATSRAASRSSTRRSRSPRTPDPARAVRSKPEASIVQAARAVADGPRRRSCRGGSTGAALAAGLFHIGARRGIHRPALALPMPIPGAPVMLLDVGANAEVRPEHLVQFAFMGAAFAQRGAGRRAAARRRCSPTARSRASGTPDVVAAHERLRRAARRACDFVGNVEGSERDGGRRRRGRDRRLHRQRRAEADGGRLGRRSCGAIRDAAMASPRGQARRPAAAAGAARRCATRSTPRARAAPTCSGCAGSAWCRTGASPAPASPARSTSPRAAVREDVVGAHARERSRRRARCGAAPSSVASPASVRRVMTREQVLDPDPHHLADELDDRSRARSSERRASARTSRRTRSTSTRSCRSSRTPTASRCPTSRRRRILTVGQAVDFVLARFRRRRDATASRGPDRCRPSPTCSTGCRTTSPGRCSRTPRGPSGAPTPTSGWRSSATACSGWRSRRTCTRGWRPSASAPDG